jgi:hypothetical protein
LCRKGYCEIRSKVFYTIEKFNNSLALSVLSVAIRTDAIIELRYDMHLTVQGCLEQVIVAQLAKKVLEIVGPKVHHLVHMNTSFDTTLSHLNSARAFKLFVENIQGTAQKQATVRTGSFWNRWGGG